MSDLLKISVIIPAYNAEQYINETLESLFAQTLDLSEYEVIIINDGSTDSTPDIIKSYCELYNNVTVINQENKGPSLSRNAGLERIKGDTVFFLDADDILEKNALEELYHAMTENHADLVIAKYDLFDTMKTSLVHNLDELVIKKRIDKFDLDILNTFVLWNKLFRSSIIRDHGIRFSHLNYSEDGVFLFDYLFWCNEITGLDKVIIHYRKYNEDVGDSITTTINDAKVRDYIKAHHLINSAARKSFLKKYEQYTDFEKARKEQTEIQTYFVEILRKEFRILLMNFYPKFWKLEQSTIDLITEEIRDNFFDLDISAIASLANDYPMYPLRNLEKDRKTVLEKAVITAALYGDPENVDAFLTTLITIINQDYIYMVIIVPESMREFIISSNLDQGNIQYCPCGSRMDFYNKLQDIVKTEYLCVADFHFSYRFNAFSYMVKQLDNLYIDFLAQTIYHNLYGNIQPIVYSRIVSDSFENGHFYNDAVCLDMTLANKFYVTDFFRDQYRASGGDLKKLIERSYRKGAFRYYSDEKVVYGGSEEEYRERICSPESGTFLDHYMGGISSLSDKKLMPNPGKVAKALLPLSDDDPLEKAVKDCVAAIYKQPQSPLDQVLFVSIRSDDELTGNALALYNSLKGCKKEYICSRLPHDRETAVKITEGILKSRIIVTDDYLKYVRYIPLRPQQRLVQLWHGCGAFKKFGSRGTNLPVKTDAATHVQYNLVCVTGEAVRPIYADAFNVELEKVQALGAPRTDMFFNEKLKESIRRRIYKDHPILEKKRVILYAPTFRDNGRDRTCFDPDLDFSRLSETLQSDQIMIICPHPLMKNDILDKPYDNLFVFRDYSTNDYMLVSDLLITDYSSVIFEYALLKKPIVFFCYDIQTYERGFYLRYPDDLPGPVLTSQDELMDYLANLKEYKISSEYELFAEKYIGSCDGHCSDRIAGIIAGYAKIPYFLLTDKYKRMKKKLVGKRVPGGLIGFILQRLENFYGI